jgi:hypothetical protein
MIITSLRIKEERADSTSIPSDHSAITIKVELGEAEFYHNDREIRKIGNTLPIYKHTLLDLMQLRNSILLRTRFSKRTHKINIIEDWENYWRSIERRIINTSSMEAKHWKLIRLLWGRSKSKIVQGVTTDKGIITEQHKLEHIMKDFYTKHFSSSNKAYVNRIRWASNRIDLRLFRKQVKMIDFKQIQKKFKKNTMSVDLLDPSKRLTRESYKSIIDILSYSGIPKDWLKSKLILISKQSSPFPFLGRHRPISINSFPLRVTERVLQSILKKWTKCDLNLGDYQLGFRTGGDARINVLRVLNIMKANKKWRILSIDLTSAFDNIPRRLLVEWVLKKAEEIWSGCRNILYFICELLRPYSMYYGETPVEIKANNGTPQGGIFRPFLFNLTLDQILKENISIRALMNNKALYAYADDIIVILENNTHLAISLIEVLNKHGLKANKEKWVYMGPKSKQLDIIAKKQVGLKYLGVWIGRNKKTIINKINTSTRDILKFTKWRIKELHLENRIEIITRIIRAAITYITTPYLAAKILDMENVLHIYLKWLKSICRIPRYISSQMLRFIIQAEDFVSFQDRWIETLNINYQKLHGDFRSPSLRKWTLYPFKSKLNFTWEEIKIWWAITSNSFYTDYQRRKPLWICGSVWTPIHRTRCEVLSMTDIALTDKLIEDINSGNSSLQRVKAKINQVINSLKWWSRKEVGIIHRRKRLSLNQNKRLF